MASYYRQCTCTDAADACPPCLQLVNRCPTSNVHDLQPSQTGPSRLPQGPTTPPGRQASRLLMHRASHFSHKAPVTCPDLISSGLPPATASATVSASASARTWHTLLSLRHHQACNRPLNNLTSIATPSTLSTTPPHPLRPVSALCCPSQRYLPLDRPNEPSS